MSAVLETAPAPPKRIAIETHYVRVDAVAPRARLARAVCGKLIDPRRDVSGTPTCAGCQQWVRAFEAMEI